MIHRKYSFCLNLKKTVNVNGRLIKSNPIIIKSIFFLKKLFTQLLVHPQYSLYKNLHSSVNDNGNFLKRDFNFIHILYINFLIIN